MFLESKSSWPFLRRLLCKQKSNKNYGDLFFTKLLFLHRISNQNIASYQMRLKLLNQDKSSSLHDFKKFSQKGASRLEGLTIQSLKRDIRRHFEALLRFNFEEEEQWKQFSSFDEVAQARTFDTSKLTNHIKYQYKFLLAMTETQLLAEFFQNKVEAALHDKRLQERARLFLADWLFFKWKHVEKTKHPNEYIKK